MSRSAPGWSAEADGQFLDASDEIRAHPANRATRRGAGITPKKLPEEDPQLHLGEAGAEAIMLAGAKAQLRELGAGHVKAEGIGENLFVSIGGDVPKDHLVASAN